MKADHEQVVRLLKTARGQIDGILKMVEEDRYCMDVSNQLMATQSILKKTNRMVLTAHMNCCVREAIASEDFARAEELANQSSAIKAQIEAKNADILQSMQRNGQAMQLRVNRVQTDLVSLDAMINSFGAAYNHVNVCMN